MYKNIHTDLKKIDLNEDLYKLHKDGKNSSDFGMDNTTELLENGFGLYSTVNVKKFGPVKTQYFRISLTRHGNAEFNMGLEKYTVERNSILFGIPGQIFSLNNFNDNFLAYYMLFTDKFIPASLFKLNRQQQFPFLSYSGLQCFKLDDTTADEIEKLILQMNSEIKDRKADHCDMIKLYIQQIILHANRCYGTVLLSSKNSLNANQNLFREFIKTVNQHFLTIRKVGEYANMLHVSPDHLNRAIKSCSEKTAHELIDEMLLMEAKAYLLHTQLSISEIAYKLEFSDPSHFNRFFKKYCEQTPVEFRNQS